MYGYVAITLRSRRFGYNHQIWLKSYSTIRRIRVRLRPGLGYDQVIGYDDVRLMLGDVGWQWRFVLSGLKVASQDLVTILDSRVTGLVGVYVLCLCYGTVFAIVLSLPSCCLCYIYRVLWYYHVVFSISGIVMSLLWYCRCCVLS